MSNLRFPSINQIALSGRLCQDPESKLMDSGKLLVTFTLASNNSYRDKNGDWQQDATFIPVSAWDKLAEYSAERLNRGSAIYLTGKLNSRTFKARSGNRTVLEVIARTLQFLR
jgi:single-strand DNA-binding protein